MEKTFLFSGLVSLCVLVWTDAAGVLFSWVLAFFLLDLGLVSLCVLVWADAAGVLFSLVLTLVLGPREDMPLLWCLFRIVTIFFLFAAAAVCKCIFWK